MDNPWNQQAPIAGIEKTIVIGSGKGGVGKSTVAANLAVALQKGGHKVGLLDADLYGPSLPRIMGALGQRPEMTEDQKILPLVRYGLKLMSMGFLIEENAAVVWRGPMLFKAIHQFLRDVQWGELDYLLVDLPPGTGDIPLSMAQKVPVDGAIVVCTPQNMALTDAKKAVDMFLKINIPILGVVENMASFTPPGQSEALSLFPRGDLHTFLETQKISQLAELPFTQGVALSCEAGVPAVESDPNIKKKFVALAKKVEEHFVVIGS